MRPNDKNALERGFYLDDAAAQRVADFAKRYCLTDFLEWQYRDIVHPLFAWRQADKRRRFRRAYIQCGKKSGKSFCTAVISLFLLMADGEEHPAIYSVSGDQQQAGIVFDYMSQLIKASPRLDKRLEVIESKKLIKYHGGRNRKHAGFYKAMASDSSGASKQGFHASAVIFDEISFFKRPEIYSAWQYAGSARKHPLYIAITTPGFDLLNNPAYDLYGYSKLVDAGTVDDLQFYSKIYEPTTTDDAALATKEKHWHEANPGLGTVIDLETFRSELKQARAIPADWSVFKAQRLGVWTEKSDAWIPLEKWKSCEAKFTAKSLEGMECVGGMDIGSVDDMTCLVLLFSWKDRYRVLPFYWCSEEAVKRRSITHKNLYGQWKEKGFLKVTPGETTDQAIIEQDILDIAERFEIRQIATDQWNAVRTCQNLIDEGLDIVFYPQNIVAMNEPTKILQRWILTKRIQHNGHPILEFNLNNCRIDTDNNGNIKVSKKRSREDKVDGITALCNAIAVDLTGFRSAYESEDAA